MCICIRILIKTYPLQIIIDPTHVIYRYEITASYIIRLLYISGSRFNIRDFYKCKHVNACHMFGGVQNIREKCGNTVDKISLFSSLKYTRAQYAVGGLKSENKFMVFEIIGQLVPLFNTRRCAWIIWRNTYVKIARLLVYTANTTLNEIRIN